MKHLPKGVVVGEMCLIREAVTSAKNDSNISDTSHLLKLYNTN